MRQMKIPFSIDRSGGVSFTTSDSVVDRLNVITICGTEPGERAMRPTYGVPTRHMVFENADDGLLSSELRSDIETQVAAWEPRVSLTGVNMQFPNGVTDPDGAKIKVRVEFVPAPGRISDEPGVAALTVGGPRGS